MKPWTTLTSSGQLRRLQELARTALDQYGIEPSRLVPVKHQHNTTIRVTADDEHRYVLRIHRPGQHSLDAIRSETLWLAALKRDTTLPVPMPVPARDGSLVVVATHPGVPEPRACVLLRWVDGRFLDASLMPAHLARVGELTARLHEHTARWRPPSGFVRGRVDILTAEARRLSRFNPAAPTTAPIVHPTDADARQTIRIVTRLCSPEDGKLVEDTIGRVREVLNELGYSPNVFGLIHGDLHQANYCFRRGEVHAIDFDDCGYGHHLFDLNVTLIELQHLPRYPELREALLRGYRRIRPLPAEHVAYLPTFFALRRLQLLVWVLESREHPAFRDEWRPWSRDLLDELRSPLASREDQDGRA